MLRSVCIGLDRNASCALGIVVFSTLVLGRHASYASLDRYAGDAPLDRNANYVSLDGFVPLGRYASYAPLDWWIGYAPLDRQTIGVPPESV